MPKGATKNCPSCHKPVLSSAQDLFSTTSNPTLNIKCPHCQHKLTVIFKAKPFIEIIDIQTPKE